MDVNTHLVSLDLFVVLALIGVAIALTRLALELVALLIRSPLLLNESRHTLLTLVAASVVRTTTDQLVRSTLIKVITHLGMTVTDTTTADRDITDTVEISSGNSWILFSNSHQVSKQILGPQQSEPNIGSSGPILKHL